MGLAEMDFKLNLWTCSGSLKPQRLQDMADQLCRMCPYSFAIKEPENFFLEQKENTLNKAV
jgi:hypothetical protein